MKTQDEGKLVKASLLETSWGKERAEEYISALENLIEVGFDI